MSVMARITLFFLLLACMAWAPPARASGDFGCSPSWKLAHGMRSDCDDMALIGPGNDSRTNLMLFMADVPGAAVPPTGGKLSVFLDLALLAPRAAAADGNSLYSDGEGSRCRSNAAGIASFEAAVAANGKVPEKERSALVAARRGLQPDCSHDGAVGTSVTDATATIKSAAGKAFAAYLEGAAAFYAAGYDAATARFATLASARDPWLRETARYMLGRVAVNRAQVDYYDEYGSPKQGMKIDPRILSAAETALRDYMKAYPKGAYFFSARGLIRRVHWLAGDFVRLEAEYAALLAMPAAERGIDAATLAQEIDAKLLPNVTPETVRDPTLLAVLDLMRMRVGKGYDGSPCCGTPIDGKALEAQRARFAANPALFDYLLAVHAYYVAAQPAGIVRLIPDASHQANFTYLQFSRQMLRGIVLDAKGDRNARSFWIDLLPGAVRPGQRPVLELALALHEERNHALARVFEPGSLIRTPEIREILLVNVADAALLRQQAQAAGVPAHEREVALFTLLYKEATRGSHRDFVNDVRLVPAGAPSDANFYDLLSAEHPPTAIFTQGKALGDYGCPALSQTQSRLAASPGDARATLCVGEFMRVNGFDGIALDGRPPVDELGGSPSLFAGAAYSRLDAYQAVMAAPKASADEKAYALFRAVNCYAPSRSNECGGQGVEPATRKAWFQRLKRDYPKSRWAQELDYYW
jgi:hypothetical protein